MFLWDHPASPGERRFAFAVVAVSTAIFLVVAPFAQVPLAPVPAFIPIYESALIINDLVTAVFLLGQFHIARSKALLLLACGYLFTALMALAHALSFPQALAGKARRAGEMAARYGGEEFALLLPHTEIEDAHRLAEVMCNTVREQKIAHAASEVAPYVTISVGVASAAHTVGRAARETETAARIDPSALLKAADQALYQAKRTGRNRVVSARGESMLRVVAEQPPTSHAA